MRTKLLGLLLAALLVLGFAGQGMATTTFGPDSMIRTYYDSALSGSSTETATNMNTSLLTSATYSAGVIGDVIGSSLLPSFSTAKVSYWGYSGLNTSSDQYWVSNNGSAPKIGGGQSDGLGANIDVANGGFSGVVPNYNGAAGAVGSVSGAPNSITIARANGYYGGSEGTGSAQGSFFSTMTPAQASISLAALATTGYVDTTFWYFNYNGSQSAVSGVSLATLRTYRADANGSENFTGGLYVATEIIPSAVPIPPSVLLLGSGLLGLIGLRRRSA